MINAFTAILVAANLFFAIANLWHGNRGVAAFNFFALAVLIGVFLS